MKLSDLNILDVGNTIQLVGAVYADGEKMLLCLFPEDRGVLMRGESESVVFYPSDTPGHEVEVHVLDMGPEDWQTFLRQTDILEVEILTKASDGTLAKAIIRKSQRQIDTNVQWKVFKRDGYRCRYCGNDDCPLTVDHLIQFEVGGPYTLQNLVSACRKCNKVRGNTDFPDWLRHPRYKDLSKRLTPEVRALNEALLGTLDTIPRVVNQRSR